ncbi:MAG: 2-dehydropantoate 2-reductase [Planctomycetota bacterium]|nr:MAG: 2-dehydropantoate 2-reductase [Planctomycetota bacterium]
MSTGRIGIIGPGALGLVFATFFHKAKFPLFLVDHSPDRAVFLNQNGILMEWEGKSISSHPPVLLYDKIHEPPLFWLVSVKHHQIPQVLKRIPNPSQSPFLFIQNGLGIQEMVSSYLEPENYILGITQIGATLLEVGKVSLSALGTTLLDASHPKSEEIQSLFHQANLPIELHPHIEAAIWQKALLNSALNPLTAILQVQNGAILAQPSLWSLFCDLLKEGELVAERQGFSFPHLIVFAKEVIAKTAQNLSSMAQDLKKGKKTEIHALSGYLIEKARTLGLSLPKQETLYALVTAMEEIPKTPTQD